uniref:acyltransferase family protein n=1 Tax=Enorma massiliensis TaxID=1472761 RepID=UPI003AB27E4B
MTKQQTSLPLRGAEKRAAGLPVRGTEQRTAGRPAPSAEQAPAGHLATDTERRSRYIPALDGIRTLAVIAVVLYHLNLTWAQGGFLGVTIFFVLSGYLITRLLLAEFEQTDRIDLKRFWVRRVRRLVPATITLVVVVAVLCTIFNHVMLTKMRPDILPSLFFFNNWWQIAQNVSYFDALGDPSPLTHFWSLAIEEQFYVVWPVLLLIMLKLRVKRPWMRRIVVALAAVSAVTMAVLYDPAADPSRVYYGTDTRAFSMLLGAWLAFIPESSMSPAKLLQTVGLGKLLPQMPT